MGLDLTIYKENKKGKRTEIASFGRDAWPIVTYFETYLDKELNDCQISVSKDEIISLIYRCKDVLIAYYNRDFEDTDSWIVKAKFELPIYINANSNNYDNNYIENISYIYNQFWEIIDSLWDDETVIFDINY